MCRLRIEGLTTSVVNGSDSYDRMFAKVALLEETIAEGNKAKAKHNIKMKVAERAVFNLICQRQQRTQYYIGLRWAFAVNAQMLLKRVRRI